LDLPPAPFVAEELRRFVHTFCEECAFNQNTIRYVAYYARKPILDGKLAMHCTEQSSKAIDEFTRFDWDPAFRSKFQAVVDWFGLLPFRRLRGVILVTQTSDIRDHLDLYGDESSVSVFTAHSAIEPRNYRILITDNTPGVARGSFYVSREFGGTRTYVNMPSSTNTFALNSSICYHGSRFCPGSFKTTVVIHGEVDAPVHIELLERSLRRYGRDSIRYPGAGAAQGPAAEIPYKSPYDDA
jgi:hypothetical protein